MIEGLNAVLFTPDTPCFFCPRKRFHAIVTPVFVPIRVSNRYVAGIVLAERKRLSAGRSEKLFHVGVVAVVAAGLVATYPPLDRLRVGVDDVIFA